MRSYIYKVLASACIFAAVACEDNLITESQQDKELKAAVEQYVPNVIYNIYGKLADSSEELYKQISALKASDTFTQAQIDLMDKARSAGCEVRADMSEKELKTAVILKKFPKANLDGKDDNYIQARFDAACEAIAEDVENQSRHDAADINPKDSTNKDPLSEAMKRYNARMDSAWSDSNPNKEA